MIPLLNITPVSDVTATNSNSMGSLGDMLADIAYRNKKLQQERDIADAHNAIQSEEVKGKNKYYDQQGDTNRMIAEDREQGRKDKAEGEAGKRMAFLQDAYRKAKTPAERQMVLDQMRGHAAQNGQTLEELPAEDTATDVAPTVEAPAGAKPGFTPFDAGQKGFKTPTVNKGFAGALDAYMQSPEAGASSGAAPGSDAGADVAPEAAPGVVSPFPWDQLGLPAPPAAAPGAKPPGKGSGRFALKDKDGNLVQTFDTTQEGAQLETMIKAMSKENPAKTPEEQRVSQVAMQRALAVAPLGIEKARDEYDRAMREGIGEYKKRGAAGAGGGGAGGPSKTDMKLTAREDDLTNKIIARTARDDEVKAMHKGIAMANRARASLDSGSGMGDLDAFKSYLLDMSGKVVTDKEMDQFMRSEGAWTGWEKKVNEYSVTNPGRFPPEFTGPLRAMMERFERLNAGRLQQLGTVAKEEARLSDLSPAAQAIVYGHFTGNFGDAAPQKAFGGKAGGKAPFKSGGKSGNDRLNELLGPKE